MWERKTFLEPHILIASVPGPHRAVIAGGTRVRQYCGDDGHHITAVTWPTTKNGGQGYRPNTTEAVHYGVYREYDGGPTVRLPYFFAVSGSQKLYVIASHYSAKPVATHQSGCWHKEMRKCARMTVIQFLLPQCTLETYRGVQQFVLGNFGKENGASEKQLKWQGSFIQRHEPHIRPISGVVRHRQSRRSA